MKQLLAAFALFGVATSARAQVGQKADLDVVKWYNSPPISAEHLQGHGILVEVFRTW